MSEAHFRGPGPANLTVTRGRRPENRHVMSLPSNVLAACPISAAARVAEQIGEGLGRAPPTQIAQRHYLVAVWDDPVFIRGLKGVQTAKSRGCCTIWASGA